MAVMAGHADDTKGTTKPPPTPAPPRPPVQPLPAAERLSVIWLRDTKDKPQPA